MNLQQEQSYQQAAYFRLEIKKRSDRLMNYFLTGFFLIGLALAAFYDTWLIALGVGGISLIAYYSVKIALPESDLYQYVLSAVYGIFMAQFIYEMHGMFEMHFFAFIGSAILITYQKWRLQIPILIVVFVHHAIFSYLQDIGFPHIYFSQLIYFDFQTFVIHILLAVGIIFICGLWAYQLNKYNEIQINQTLQMAELQKDAQLSIERKRNEDVLLERNTILESISDAFFATDKNWIVTYWNSTAEKISGKSKGEVIGNNLWEIYQDNSESVFYKKLQMALDADMPQHFDALYEASESWYEISAYPSVNGLSVYYKNISERKISELKMKRLNEDLHQQAKELLISNAELEQFAYVVSHDLQEPLRMVTGFMTQLEKKYGNLIDDRGKQYIQYAVDGGKRMRQIILDLLEFSQVGTAEDKLEDVNIKQVVLEIQGLYRRKIEETKAKIEIGNLPVLHTFKTPVRQVFQNLISNSLKYQKYGERPEISISCVETSRFWQFSVKDNGIGICEEHFDKIFTIFQRLHTGEENPGNGMGLAVAKKIVENLGGKIWVDSQEGGGSTFYFSISKNLKKQLA